MAHVLVSGWLLILLSVLSLILLLLIVIFLVSFIANRLLRRKYDQIRPAGKYVPGKVLAYFKRSDKDTHLSITPKTYPAVLQTVNPLIIPPWKIIPYTSSMASSNSSNLQPHSASRSPECSYDPRTGADIYQEPTWNSAPASLDDMQRFHSNMTEIKTDDCRCLINSWPGSMVGDVMTADDFYLELMNSEWDQVYSHSNFLVNGDSCTSFGDPDDVISFDQDHHLISKLSEPGSLFFVLEYNLSIPELLVTVKSGLDLRPVNDGKSSPLHSYVNFCLVPEDFLWQKTKVVMNKRNPVFNETFRIHDVLYHKLREYTLCFFIMDCTNPLSEGVVGKVLYPLSDLRADARVEICKELSFP